MSELTTKDPTAEIIGQYLVDEGLAVDADALADWQVFIGTMPDCGDGVRDNALAIYDISGARDGRIMRSGQVIVHPGLQIRVRSTTYSAGWAKTEAIADLIDATDRQKTVTLGTSTYRLDNLSRLTGILPGGREPGARRRDIFTLNINTTITQTA